MDTSRSSWAKSCFAAFVLLGCGVLATGCCIQIGQDADGTPTDTGVKALLKKYPPAGGAPAVIDQIPGWTTTAWLSTNQALCSAAIRSAPKDGEANEYSECVSAPAALLTAGEPKLTSPPIPRTAPTNPASQTLVLFIGTVRGPAATVEVSVPDATVTSATYPLTMTGTQSALAYAVWLPTRGEGMGGLPWAGITSVVAYDKDHRAVERIDVA